MNNENTKLVEIKVPESMTPEQAQKCLIVGMRFYLDAYRGSVLVSYSNGDDIVNLVFFEKEGRTIIDFVNALYQNKKQWNEKTKDMETKGNELIDKLFTN